MGFQQARLVLPWFLEIPCFNRIPSLTPAFPSSTNMASLVVQTVKNPPATQETWVQSLSGEDLLKKEMATHCSILAWKIPWMEEPCRLQFMGSQELDTT